MVVLLGMVAVGLVVFGLAAVAEKAAGSSTSSTSSTGSTGSTGSGSLPAAASGKLNSSQRSFASELAAQTGLDPTVVAAWVLSEEPASSSSAPNGANNWLNVGSTDSGFYGAGNPAWSDPVQAADFTASWIRGASAPGFGKATAGIRAILQTAGQAASAQIAAIQGSGWATGGYPGLPSVVASLGGTG